jgi:hypothetical protein
MQAESQMEHQIRFQPNEYRLAHSLELQPYHETTEQLRAAPYKY